MKENLQKLIENYKNNILPEYEHNSDISYFVDIAGSEYWRGMVEGITKIIEEIEEIMEKQ